MAIEVGTTAPEFDLVSHTNERFTLSQFKDTKTVLLAFYVFDFTGG